MKKLKIYKNGDAYIIGTMNSIEPTGIDSVEEYDISSLTEDELKQLEKNKKDKNLLKKGVKLK